MNIEKEILRLLASRDWRLRHLYWISDKSGNLIRFKPNWAQERILKDYHSRMDVLKARQLGVSTLTGLLILDMCLFAEGVVCGVVDKARDDAEKKLANIRFAWEHLDYVGDGSPYALALARVGHDLKARTGVLRRSHGLMRRVPLVDNATDLEFANRSRVSVGTSMRGGTYQFLHISELAYVSLRAPKTASEIKAGSLSTVGSDGVIMKESTHEGGRSGTNYEMTRVAMENIGREHGALDYRFFFFPWWGNPEYRDGTNAVIGAEMSEYFTAVERANDCVLDREQRNWYVSTSRVLGDKMMQEYPSSIDEALMARVEGAIYGDILEKMRALGYVGTRFEWTRGCQLYTAWDIGVGDATSVWLFNVTPTHIEVLEYCEGNGLPASHYAGIVQGWMHEYGVVRSHFLPHDGSTRSSGDCLSYRHHLEVAGLTGVELVPRTANVWSAINVVRGMLWQFRFHANTTAAGRDGGNSGVDHLCLYRTAPVSTAGERVKPFHDGSSHAADAFRQFVQAVSFGMVQLGFGVSQGAVRGARSRVPRVLG